MTVEFIGGPKDGEVWAVEDNVHTVEIAMAPALDPALWEAELLADPFAPPKFRRGQYRSTGRLADRGKMFWQGE